MISIKCFAKINLCLRVLGKRDDGYHEIDTIFQSIDLADTLVWRPGPEPPVLVVRGADTGPPERNLVLRAANLFREATGHSVGGLFRLEKVIPVGGGLGGGSSDAAAALRILNRYFQEPLGPETMDALAAELGSDVPFFLRGGCLRGRGRGELLTPADFDIHPRRGFLLIPPIGLSTAEIYRRYRPGNRKKSGRLSLGENDLLEPALNANPVFAELYRNLASAFAGDPFFMTGSGSSLVWLVSPEKMDPGRTRLLMEFGVSWTPFLFLEKFQLNS